MVYNPFLTVEMKMMLMFMSLGLTSWYLTQRYLNDGLVELITLFGVGVVLPMLINKLHQRSRMEWIASENIRIMIKYLTHEHKHRFVSVM